MKNLSSNMEIIECLQGHLLWKDKGKSMLEVKSEKDWENRNWRQKYRQSFQEVLP